MCGRGGKGSKGGVWREAGGFEVWAGEKRDLKRIEMGAEWWQGDLKCEQGGKRDLKGIEKGEEEWWQGGLRCMQGRKGI